MMMMAGRSHAATLKKRCIPLELENNTLLFKEEAPREIAKHQPKHQQAQARSKHAHAQNDQHYPEYYLGI